MDENDCAPPFLIYNQSFVILEFNSKAKMKGALTVYQQ